MIPRSVDYTNFVRARFKTFTDSPEASGQALTLHHAATGMIGELTELLGVKNEEECIEELGDFEFYLEAFIQNTFPERRSSRNVPIWSYGDADSCMLELLRACGDILDQTKKLWIYNKPVKLDDFTPALDKLYAALVNLYKQLDFSHAKVLTANIKKLLKRYPAGYADAAALARADKT